MERLTENKEVSEMGMYELAHNCCYQKDGWARYRDFETDIDARELVRRLMKKHANIELSQNTDVFDDEVLDMLMYSTDTIEGLIALFYRNLWAMADLRETLKSYEDTNLTPEQIIEIDKAYSEMAKELGEYKKLDEQELLLKLLCKVGDTVWVITHPYNVTKDEQDLGSKKEVFEAKCKSATIYKKSIQYRFTVDGEFIGEYFSNDSFEKTVFLTKEEAEAKLKEMESK